MEPPTRTPPTRAQTASIPGRTPNIVGLALLALSFMLCLLPYFGYFAASPLLLVAFIMGIVGAAKGDGVLGLANVLGSVAMIPVVWLMKAFFGL